MRKAVFFAGPNARQFDITKCTSVLKATNIIRSHDDSFLLQDTAETKKRAAWWKLNLPWLKPKYAIKCNCNLLLLRSLASAFRLKPAVSVGSPGIVSELEALQRYRLEDTPSDHQMPFLGFDCASAAELSQIRRAFPTLDMSQNVILSNQTKKDRDLLEGKKYGVRRTVASTMTELDKIANIHPQAEILLRLRIQNDKATSQMQRFGCTEEGVPQLLEHIKHKDLKFVGFHWHVGSGGPMESGIATASATASRLMHEVRKRDMHVSLLDWGGGFTPQHVDKDVPALDRAHRLLNKVHADLFAGTKAVRHIAEPGRLLAQEAFSLVCTVLNKEIIHMPDGSTRTMLTINDSKYGSFSGVPHDNWKLNQSSCFSFHQTQPGKWHIHGAPGNMQIKRQETLIAFQTCDGSDMLPWSLLMEEVNVGDHLIWGNMGAYAVSASCHFNGMPVASETLVHL